VLFGPPPDGYDLALESLAPAVVQARYIQRFHVLSEAAGFESNAAAFDTE
jgi:uncharacterized protein